MELRSPRLLLAIMLIISVSHCRTSYTFQKLLLIASLYRPVSVRLVTRRLNNTFYYIRKGKKKKEEGKKEGKEEGKK